MKLDTVTILLALCILCSGFSVAMLLTWRLLLPMRSLSLWSCGMGCYGLGVLLIALRGRIPDLFSMLLGNLLLLVCYGCIWAGVSRYRGKQPWYKTTLLLLLLFMPVFGWFVWVDHDIAVRTALVRAFMIIFLGGTLVSLYRGRATTFSAMERVVAVAFLLDLLFRTTLLTLQLAHMSHTESLQKNMITAVSAIMSIVSMISWGFAVVLLAIEVTAAELHQAVTERQQLLEQNQKNSERLAAMLDVSQCQAQTVQQLLDFSLQKVIDITDSTIGYIYHYSEESQEFVLNSWSKEVMPICTVANPQSTYQLEKTGVWGEAVRQRRPIIINDFTAPDPLLKGYPEGHVHLFRFLTIPVFDAARKIVAVVGVANKLNPYTESDQLQLTLMMDGVWKIVKRLEMEQRLERTGREWQTTFDAITDSVSLLDAEQRVLRCNRASKAFFSGKRFSEIIGHHCWELMCGSAGPIENCPMIRAQKSLKSETEIIRQGDRWLQVTVDPVINEQGQMTSAVHIVHDDTSRIADQQEMHELHAQLLQNEKMASIGQLSAGIAHEINNPMGFINSNLGTLEKYLDKFDRYIALLEDLVHKNGTADQLESVHALRKHLKLDYVVKDIHQLIGESAEGTERVMKIVKDLKAFSHSDTGKMGQADLNQCLDSTINIIWNKIKYVAELERNYGEIPKVLCNVQKVNQVIMNLLSNAVHAIEVKGAEEPGVIGVRTWAEGAIVFISVSDTGCGMNDEVRRKIFDPFFTTKDVGQGTGLGLSISHEIIKNHGGEITVESQPGKGTTFTVRLPVNPPAAA